MHCIFRIVAVFGILMVFLTGIAIAGDITGTVTLAIKKEAAPAKSIRGIYSGGNGAKEPAAMGAPKAVVFIADHPTPELAPPNARYAIAQEGTQFKPDLLAVMVGSTIDFPNNDNVYHNVFSYSPTKRFDLGRYEQGKSKSVQFDKPGIVRVFCEIHSHMRANILVVENPWFTIAEHGKPFRIPEVPAGTYTLTVWHERLDAQTRDITVPQSGHITIDFSL